MGIEPHFNLWNYFRAQLQQGSGVEAAALGSVDIFIRSGHEIYPYFHLPTFILSEWWWKVLFFSRNNTDAPLPMFMSSRPIPQPN
jgi:hypothetical protein